ncbi:MAG: helix-turn-helix domain-containing protein [Pseudonocardiaceae bacterium]
MDEAVKPGIALRQLRLAKGVGLRGLARDICCDPGHLSRMESGVRPLSLECAQLADRFLDTGGAITALVRAGYAGQRWRDRSAEPNGALRVVEVDTPEGRITVSVPRRDLLMTLGIGAVGSSVLRDLHRVAVLPDAVGDLDKALEGFSIAGRVMPPSQLLDALTGRVAVISAMRQKASSGVAARLAMTQARYAEFLSWMHEETGDLVQAIWWIDRASEWAHVGSWVPMVAFTSVRKSVMATMHAADAHRTVDFAQVALHTNGATPAVLRFAAAQLAYGHALAGDLGGSRRALDLATSYYQKAAAGPQDEPSIGARSVLDHDPVELNWATCNIFAGRGEPAIGVLATRMDAVKGVSPRAYAIHGARLAHAYALAGHPDEVQRTLAEVLDTTAVTESATTRRELGRICPVLRSRWPRRSDLRDIAQRLAVLA